MLQAMEFMDASQIVEEIKRCRTTYTCPEKYLILLFDGQLTHDPYGRWRRVQAFASALAFEDLPESYFEEIVEMICEKLTDSSSDIRFEACKALSELFQNIGEFFFRFFHHIYERLVETIFDDEPLVRNAANVLNEALKDCARNSLEFRNFVSVHGYLHFTRVKPKDMYIEDFVEWILVPVRSMPSESLPSGALETLFKSLGVLDERTKNILMQVCCNKLRSFELTDLTATMNTLVDNMKNNKDTRSMLLYLVCEVMNFPDREIVEVYHIALDTLLHTIVQDWESASPFVRHEVFGDMIEKLRNRINQVPDEKLTNIMTIAMRYIKPEYLERGREEAIQWISVLIKRIKDTDRRTQGINVIMQSLFDLSDEALSRIVKNHFTFMDDNMQTTLSLRSLLNVFRYNMPRIAERGKHIIHVLRVAKDAVFVIPRIAKLLQEESDLDLLDNLVPVLAELLLDSPHLTGVRKSLKSSCLSPDSDFTNLFTV